MGEFGRGRRIVVLIVGPGGVATLFRKSFLEASFCESFCCTELSTGIFSDENLCLGLSPLLTI